MIKTNDKCTASSTCQGSKIEGVCSKCECDICGAPPPQLTIFLWKNGKAIKLCDKHVKIVNIDKIPKKEFDQIIFITP